MADCSSSVRDLEERLPELDVKVQPLSKHESVAAQLVEQYLGGNASDTPNNGGSTFRRNSNKQTVEKLEKLLEEDAARKIQKSFRRYRSEANFRKRSFGKFGEEALELIRRYTSADGKLEEETFASKARLILHFDINKTILMTDAAQGANVEFIINALLADCAWGRLEPGPQWVPVGRLATDRPANDVQLMSYRSYLDSFSLPFESGASPEIQQRNSQKKQQRQSLKRNFTQPGQPGHMFRGVYEQLRAALVLPEGHNHSSPLFQGGDIHILPSFFNLLIHLQNQKRDFSIIIRSFGEDIAAVAEEMNMFATGQHPQYPGVRMDGSDGRTDLRLKLPDSIGLFHRSNTKPDGTALLMGGPEELLHRRKGVSRADLEQAASDGSGLLLTNFTDIHSYFMEVARHGNRALALKDYHPFWKSRNERSHAGKMMLLDTKDRDTLEIFFDDNIGHTTAHIVDVRNVHTGQPIPFQEAAGIHMLKVEPLNAILDPHYFVRAVHECVVSWLKARPTAADVHADRSATYRGRRMPYDSPDLESRTSVANTSRRARDLWSIVQTRLVTLIRMRNALRED